MRERVRAAFAPPPPPPPKDALYLGQHPVTGERIYIRARELDTHLQVCGGSRRGKTNALRYLSKSLLRRKKSHGEGFAIIDPHGGLAEYVLEICSREPALAKEVVYLNLKDVAHALALNVLRQTGQDPYFVGRCVGEGLIQAFDRTRSDEKKTTIQVFANLGEALNRLGWTLLESRFFLNRGDEEMAVLSYATSLLPPGDNRSAWRQHLKRTPHDAEMKALGPGNRLDDLIRPPILQRMFGQDACLDFLELMNRGGIAIFDTSLGEKTEITTDGQSRLNALLVQQFRQAFPRRKDKGARDYDPRKWPPFTLVLDEFGDYCSQEFARTLTQASKFGLRCVFAHQNLKQLLGADGDETLLASVLAIPNKVVFGNLEYNEAQTLAKHIYLPQFNPDEIKYQQDITYWDPEIKEVWLRSYSHSSSRTQTASRTFSTTRTAGAGRSSGTTRDAETERESAHETSNDHEAEASAEGGGDATTAGDTDAESLQQAYQTFYKKRVEKGPPIYRSVDEQVFKAAQSLACSPRGVCILAREDDTPTVCVVPKMDDRPATPEELDRFLQGVYDKPIYLPAVEADRQIEERRVKLIEAATEPRVVPTHGEPVAGAKLRKPFRPKKA